MALDNNEIAARFTEHADAVLSVLATAERKSADRASEIEAQVGGLKHEILSMKQQGIARGGSGGPTMQKSIGELFVEHPDVKALAHNFNRHSRVSVEIKTVTSVSPGGGPLVAPQRAEMAPMPMQQLPLRALLPTVAVSSNLVEYARQSVRGLAADMVSEGSRKPSDDFKWTLQSVKMEVVADTIKASRQITEDEPQLRDFISAELTYAVNLKEEYELLFGTNVSPHLNGIIPQAVAFSSPITVPTPNMVDKIATAVLQVALAGFQATGIALHPSDWARVALIKDSTGQYLASNPQAAMTPMLWGIPVSTCQTLAPDQFLVGDFRQATLYDRWTMRIDVATENEDDFLLNLLCFRGEKRLGLAVKWPAAFVTGDLGNIP